MKNLDSNLTGRKTLMKTPEEVKVGKVVVEIRKIKLLISITMLITSLFLLSNCGDSEDELSCTTNSTVDRTGQGNQCGNGKVVRHTLDVNSNLEILIIQFDMPTYNCRISVNPNQKLIEEQLYVLGEGAGFTQSDLTRTDNLSIHITKMDRTNNLISGTFDISGTSGPTGSNITYKGIFTDLEF